MSIARTMASFINSIADLAAAGAGEATLGKLLAGTCVDPTSTTSGATQSTLYDLNSVGVPLTHLANRPGKGLLIAAWGTTAANANAKDLILKVGSTTLVTKTGATDNAKNYLFLALMFRDAKDSQRGIGVLIVDTSIVALTAIATTEDEDADLTFKVQSQNTAAAAASATGKGLSVTLLG